eukprot:TRINITY_DN15293_c0_g1_i1.p1 TRINITY_DN15293_c0_g1~~TRINITY_DN15293_c0_g1_i1.p1  ORF type:complete len:736 (-),score=141.66 TRINITY_DN15293_c0_g1_i1:66-2273(-)
MSNKKPKITIKPFRHQVTMDPNYAENTWNLLRNAIHEIHKKNASGLSFEELYRNAYNMVLHKYGDRLYNGLKGVVDEHLKSVAKQVVAANDDNFLDVLNNVWNDHHQSMLMIRDILMYMDRVYVVHNNVHSVYDLGLVLFKDNVERHPKVCPRILSILLESIRRERGGEVINKGLIKNITQMLVDLGTPGVKQRSVYEDDFEGHFIETSRKFYRAESQNFISTNSASEYMKKVERRLEEEMERVKHYLDPGTESKIKEVVENELISSHMETLVEMQGSGLISMLEDNKIEDLARMFNLLGRVTKGHELMKTVLGNHVKEIGKATVSDPGNKENAYVSALLQLKEKYDTILITAFANDKAFQRTLNNAFEHFINLNPRSPEYISLFIDERLRKGLKGSEEETETILDKVMTLFRFISEKDVFEKYYKQHLARRLLLNRSISDDAERNMISKLKTECGYQFTSKLEGMFQDMKTSAKTIEAFKEYIAGQRTNPLGGVELNVHVLTTGFWPTQSSTVCNLPVEINRCCEEFKKYYLGKHNGRRLTWQINMGTGELRAFFGKKRHELNVSTFQICILLLFNDHDSLTFAQIQSATGISSVDLYRSLWSLIVNKTRILNKEPRVKKWSDDDVYSFNDKFKSNLVRIKVLPVTQSESQSEVSETQEKIDEDRKHMIEAAIVRIMKSRKTMQHVQLISEVTKQLASRFRPNPMVIKKRVESLIEREYLERSEEDRKSYNYLA